ncbi:putative aminoacrylate peracid reductase RutC [compost metagenome]
MQQTQAILDQLTAIATVEESSLKSLIKISVFLTDIADLAAIRTVLFDYFGDALPACSLMEVSGLFSPEISIEIEATLAV